MGWLKPRSMPSDRAPTSSASRTWLRSASVSMEDSLDVVAVRVEHERPVVVRVVDLAQARGAVVAAARGERGRVECVHRLAALGPERHVRATVRPPVALSDPEERELSPEAAHLRDRLHDAADPERLERLLVEGLARVVIVHVESNVIEPWLHEHGLSR